MCDGELADLIDAAWVLGGGQVGGDTGSSDYTTVDYVTGVGKGATFTPAKGDTSKKLFVPDAGIRGPDGGSDQHSVDTHLWPATQSGATLAYRLVFDGYTGSSGRMSTATKLEAYSLRCVRS